MVKNFFKRAARKLKRAALVTATAGAILSSTPAVAEHPEEGVSASVRIDGAYMQEKLMGNDFRSGQKFGFDADAEWRFGPLGKIGIESKLEMNNLKYEHDKGDKKETLAEVTAMAEANTEGKNTRFTLGVGANFTYAKATDAFERDPIIIHNKAVGPALKFGVDSKYVDFSLMYVMGFGKAGNTVHGDAELLKHKLKVNLEFPILFFVVGAYGDAEYNMFKVGEIPFDNGIIRAGCFYRHLITNNIGAQFTYEHRWDLGEIDAVQADIFKGGLYLKF